jgi:hypothetical protein
MKTRDKSLRRVAYVRELSERAQDAQLRNAAKVFADPHLFRAVLNRIFIEYLASPGSLREWSVEFVRVYKHLLDGGEVAKMPAPSLDPDVIDEIVAMVRGNDDTRRNED